MSCLSKSFHACSIPCVHALLVSVCMQSSYLVSLCSGFEYFVLAIICFSRRSGAFLNTVTVHWYKSTKETYNTPQSLLEEAPLRQDMNRLKALVAIAKR